MKITDDKMRQLTDIVVESDMGIAYPSGHEDKPIKGFIVGTLPYLKYIISHLDEDYDIIFKKDKKDGTSL